MYDVKFPPSKECKEYLTTYNGNIRKPKAIILTSLDDNSLRAVQSVSHPPETIKELNHRYSASMTAKKIASMESLIHTRYDIGKDMGEYLSEWIVCIIHWQQLDHHLTA